MAAADLVLCHTSAGHPEELLPVPAAGHPDPGSLQETARLCRADVGEDGGRRRRWAPARPRSAPPHTPCRAAGLSSSGGACTRSLCTPECRCRASEARCSPHPCTLQVALPALPAARRRRPRRRWRHRAARGAAGKTRALQTRLWESKRDAGWQRCARRLPAAWPLCCRGSAPRCTVPWGPRCSEPPGRSLPPPAAMPRTAAATVPGRMEPCCGQSVYKRRERRVRTVPWMTAPPPPLRCWELPHLQLRASRPSVRDKSGRRAHPRRCSPPLSCAPPRRDEEFLRLHQRQVSA